MPKKKNIGQLLLKYKIISRDDLNKGLLFQKKTSLRLGEALVKLGKITTEDIEWILSKQLEIPFVIVENIDIDRELAGKFPKEFLISNRIIPVHESDDHIAIVTDDPLNHPAVEFVEKLFGKKASLSTGSGEKIDKRLGAFFNQDGLPELIYHLKDMIARIQETCFYRLDFMLCEGCCEISLFGFGIFRRAVTIHDAIRKEDIFKSLNSLDIPFLYDQFSNDGKTLLTVYPLTRKMEDITFPAIMGGYGLYLPEGTVFADALVHGLPDFFHSDRPVPGYPFVSTRWSKAGPGNIIYTIDAAPEHFEQYYVNLFVPGKCGSCGGSGCRRCRDLGYEFRAVQGTYSSSDLKKCLAEE